MSRTLSMPNSLFKDIGSSEPPPPSSPGSRAGSGRRSWSTLGLLAAVLGAIFFLVALPRHTHAGLFLLPEPSAPALQAEHLPIPPDFQSRHPERALPCRHIRTTGCSLECPHEAGAALTSPGLLPDLAFERPETAPFLPCLSPGVFREPAPLASPVRTLPDPPPRLSSLRTSDNPDYKPLCLKWRNECLKQKPSPHAAPSPEPHGGSCSWQFFSS